jgi:hypothetical protein
MKIPFVGIGGRRFILVLLVVTLATFALHSGHLTSDHYKDIINFIVLVFVAGNVAQKGIERWKPEQSS